MHKKICYRYTTVLKPTAPIEKSSRLFKSKASDIL